MNEDQWGIPVEKRLRSGQSDLMERAGWTFEPSVFKAASLLSAGMPALYSITTVDPPRQRGLSFDQPDDLHRA